MSAEKGLKESFYGESDLLAQSHNQKWERALSTFSKWWPNEQRTQQVYVDVGGAIVEESDEKATRNKSPPP